MEPLVSVVTITYNHERYIAKCIEGVLMQRVAFPMEFIIGEDCSTDGTRAICEEYARKYPELIKLITSDSNIGYNPNELRAMKAARGKYIAYCEGDDFWTDPLKLQKQVDFMESHPDYSVCFHRCRHYYDKDGKYRDDTCNRVLPDGAEGIDVTLDLFFARWITQPLTMVFRKSALDLSKYGEYRYYRDMHQIYHFLKHGRGYLFAFFGGVRTIHDGGIASKRSEAEKCREGVEIAKELYENNGDKPTRVYYSGMMQWYLDKLGNSDGNRALFSWRIFLLTGNPVALLKNLTRR